MKHISEILKKVLKEAEKKNKEGGKMKVIIDFEVPEITDKKGFAKTLNYIIARSIPVDEIDFKIQGEKDFYIGTGFNRLTENEKGDEYFINELKKSGKGN